jgi:hypothetical protein
MGSPNVTKFIEPLPVPGVIDARNGWSGPIAAADLALGRVERVLADEDPVDRSRGLQPGRGVHDVACNHALAFVRRGVESDERLPRVDGDADVEVASWLVLVQACYGVTNRQCSSHRSFRVVLVSDWGPEHRDDGVADELLHRPTEALELLARSLVVHAQECPHVLGVARLGPCRRADEVDEDDADDLPLFASTRNVAQRRAAFRAELRRFGVLEPARSTRLHTRSLGRLPERSGTPAGGGRGRTREPVGSYLGIADERWHAEPAPTSSWDGHDLATSGLIGHL